MQYAIIPIRRSDAQSLVSDTSRLSQELDDIRKKFQKLTSEISLIATNIATEQTRKTHLIGEISRETEACDRLEQVASSLSNEVVSLNLESSAVAIDTARVDAITGEHIEGTNRAKGEIEALEGLLVAREMAGREKLEEVDRLKAAVEEAKKTKNEREGGFEDARENLIKAKEERGAANAIKAGE